MGIRFGGASVIAALVFASGALGDGMSTEDILNKHLTAFGAGDVEGLMEDYDDRSVILLQSGPLEGTDAIRGMVEALVAEFSKPGMTFGMETTRVSGNVGYIVWRAETADNVYEYGTDTFVFEDGKIRTQTLTFKAIPK